MDTYNPIEGLLYPRHKEMNISYIKHVTWGLSDMTGGEQSILTCNITIP